LPTTAVTFAPASCASWTANRPTPPAAPVIATLDPSSDPPSASVPSAVRPATGSVDADSNERSSGIGARWPERTATRSAHPPPLAHAVTRVPPGGLEPSSAGSAITPATSHPGRHPSGALWSALHSPRLRDDARTSTMASFGSRSGSSTSRSSMLAAGLVRDQCAHQVTIW
jgi:hypothetical protein